MPLVQVTHRHLLEPRRNLDRWVNRQAELAQAEHGFSYIPSAQAPSSYTELLDAFEKSQRTGDPYPVNPDHNENVIFATAETNWAMRYVHDLEHAKRGLSFSSDDELVLGLYHLEALAEAGYDRRSLEYRLLQADTIGQAKCVALLGRFPYNQRLFAYDCVDLGVDVAVGLEATETEPAA